MRVRDIASALAAASTTGSDSPDAIGVSVDAELDIERLVDGLPLSGAAAHGPLPGLFDSAVVWDTRCSPSLPPELTVCMGATLALDASGPDREARLRLALARAFDRIGGPAASRARAFGALSFDSRGGIWGDGWFFVPRWTLTSRPDRGTEVLLVVRRDELQRRDAIMEDARLIESLAAGSTIRDSGRGSSPPPSSVVDDGRVSFLNAARAAATAVERGPCEKIVLARALRVQHAAPPEAALARLASSDGCVRFALRRGATCFLGASPELLVRRAHDGVWSEAVAGTEPHAGDAIGEATRLLGREKDRREHRFVVDAIAGGLRDRGVRLAPPGEPGVRTLAQVHHLVTPIHGECPSDLHVLELVAALHPTPALAGTPRSSAMAFLCEHEPVARGLYGAPVGWVDRSGAGAFMAGIRSASILGSEATVFVGAGIVSGSDPDAELAETVAKARAMLLALGAAPERQGREGCRG